MASSDLMIWGLVLHFLGDWPLQNHWIAFHKKNLKHPSGYIHAAIHGALLAIVFGWWAIFLAASHLLIDTGKPVIWWGKLIKQTQPEGNEVEIGRFGSRQQYMPAWDIGTEVRLWVDQVFHILAIAVIALIAS